MAEQDDKARSAAAAREAKLAQALRANLRRRKADPTPMADRDGAGKETPKPSR